MTRFDSFTRSNIWRKKLRGEVLQGVQAGMKLNEAMKERPKLTSVLGHATRLA